jgi:hypothetical protein
MFGMLLGNWRAIGAAVLAIGIGLAGLWLGAKAGYAFGHADGHRAGWDEGRAALAAETTKALEEKNHAAAQADRELMPCLRNPDCLRTDDGWRIDRED